MENIKYFSSWDLDAFQSTTENYFRVKMGLDMENKQKVAIKIMNQEIIDGKVKDSIALESLLNEIKLCLLAKHKTVIQILDFNIGGIYKTVDGKIKRVLYYVMKIAHNGELFRLIQNEMLS
jgi:serine/threonine protein kinase